MAITIISSLRRLGVECVQKLERRTGIARALKALVDVFLVQLS